jgi:hypothetical protein
MIDLLEIAQSWYRVGQHTPEQKEIADERLAVCNGCEFKVDDFTRMFHKCGACGCPIKAKVYSPRGAVACPKNKWAR